MKYTEHDKIEGETGASWTGYVGSSTTARPRPEEDRGEWGATPEEKAMIVAAASLKAEYEAATGGGCNPGEWLADQAAWNKLMRDVTARPPAISEKEAAEKAENVGLQDWLERDVEISHLSRENDRLTRINDRLLARLERMEKALARALRLADKRRG